MEASLVINAVSLSILLLTILVGFDLINTTSSAMDIRLAILTNTQGWEQDLCINQSKCEVKIRSHGNWQNLCDHPPPHKTAPRWWVVTCRLRYKNFRPIQFAIKR